LDTSPKENQKNILWTTGLINVSCVLEVFDFKEPVSWCAQRFDSKTRMIQVTTKAKNPIILNPKVLKKIIHLPSTNKILKLTDADVPQLSGWGLQCIERLSNIICKHVKRLFCD
jgi:hypothetical protein